MVRQHEPAGGNERTRSAGVEADGGPLEVGVPGVRGLEVVAPWSSRFGGLLNSHMPSSPRTAVAVARRIAAARADLQMRFIKIGLSVVQSTGVPLLACKQCGAYAVLDSLLASKQWHTAGF